MSTTAMATMASTLLDNRVTSSRLPSHHDLASWSVEHPHKLRAGAKWPAPARQLHAVVMWPGSPLSDHGCSRSVGIAVVMRNLVSRARTRLWALLPASVGVHRFVAHAEASVYAKTT